MGLVELQLINRILQSRDFSIVTRNGLTENYFLQFKDEFNFIVEHYKVYGVIPDILTFKYKFKDTPADLEVNEAESYLVDKLYEAYDFVKFNQTLQDVGKDLSVDSRLAYEKLMSKLPDIRPTVVNKCVDITKEGADARLEKYNERKELPQESAVIKTGFKELDEIFYGWEPGEELVTILARSNQGKCLEKGTLVLMADGSKKKIEDIVIGDRVQSISGINTVIGLHNGVSNGWKIIPKRGGAPFIVSSDHILTLVERYEVWEKGVGRTGIMKERLIDITVEDYLKRHKTVSSKHLLYRPMISYPEKSLKIPPYILGIWLGDGTSCRPEITNKDDVVINAWYDYAASLGLHISKYTKRNNICSKYDLTTGKFGGRITNPVKDLLKSYNLLNNKHIPLEYLTSSYEQRMELLAGILDTDGSYSSVNNSFEVTFKSKRFCEDFMQLVRGLGYRTGYYKKLVKFNYKNGETCRYYHRVIIFGDLYRIPTRLKRALDKKPRNNPMYSRFSIEPVDQIEYYGFACDGDHRFLLGDGTVTHNSWLALKFLAEAWKQGKRVGMYSGEMSDMQQGYRFDALFNHFSNTALRRGYEVKGYAEYIENLKKVPNPFLITTPKDFNGMATVSKLRMFVEKNNLDILGVDQLSLMLDERASRGEQERIKLGHISADLYLLSCELKIPIIALVQANREAAKKGNADDNTAPQLEDIRESDDIGHNSSRVISMKQTKAGLLLNVIKNRGGRNGDKLLYHWDIDTGYFHYAADFGEVTHIQPETKKELVKHHEESAVVEAMPF